MEYLDVTEDDNDITGLHEEPTLRGTIPAPPTLAVKLGDEEWKAMRRLGAKDTESLTRLMSEVIRKGLDL